MTSVGIMASAVSLPTGVDVLLEPFNNFTFAPWTLTGTPTIVAGRHGNAASFSSATPKATYTIPALSESATVTVGFAFRVNALSNTNVLASINSDAGVTRHGVLRLLPAGGFTFSRDVNVLGTSATGLIVINTWYYVEVQTFLHDTTGTVEVRLNGTPIIGPLAGQDTKNVGTKTTFDTVQIGSVVSVITLFDDLYITTGAGAPFKGDITVP